MLALCSSVLSISGTIAEQQNYISFLQTNDIKVDPVSYISWGYADENKVELYEIVLDTDGYIDYTIDPVTEVDVTLVSSDDDNSFFGFKHGNGTFQIIVEGIVEPYNSDNGFSISTVFKVEKCGDKIFYYKDGALIYSYCANGGAKLPGMFHRTTVIEASGAIIDLDFESESTECTSNILIASGGQSLRNATDFQLDDVLSTAYESNKYVIINLFTQDGEPVKQFRKRTNKAGFITRVRDIKKFASKKDYIITIKEESIIK